MLVGMCRGKVNKVTRAPERAPGRGRSSLKMGLSGGARTRLANSRRCARAKPVVRGDELVEMKEILKMMVSGKAKSVKKFKMVMLRNGFFLEI